MVQPELMRVLKPVLRRAAAPAVAVVLLPILAGCGGGSSSSSAQDPAAQTPSQSSSSSSVPCDYPDAPQGATGNVDKPPASPDVQGKVTVTLDTSAGALVATLDADTAPCTVNSFVSLAKQGYFDKTPCHRLTTPPSTIFVLQCGDPTGTGTGGPGYTVPDEISGTETYGPGTLAMANTGHPNTGGSQFFIVYRKTPLPPQYTVFGQLEASGVTEVRKVAAKGTDNAYGEGDGHPKDPVTINGVTVG